MDEPTIAGFGFDGSALALRVATPVDHCAFCVRGGGAGEASRVGAHLRTAHSGHASKELGQAKATV